MYEKGGEEEEDGWRMEDERREGERRKLLQCREGTG